MNNILALKKPISNCRPGESLRRLPGTYYISNYHSIFWVRARNVQESVVALRRSNPRYVPVPFHDEWPKNAKYGSGEPPGTYILTFLYINLQKVLSIKKVSMKVNVLLLLHYCRGRNRDATSQQSCLKYRCLLTYSAG